MKVNQKNSSTLISKTQLQQLNSKLNQTTNSSKLQEASVINKQYSDQIDISSKALNNNTKLDISSFVGRTHNGNIIKVIRDTNGISAETTDSHGKTINIKQENLPNCLREIKGSYALNAYLKNSHLRTSKMDNGDLKLYASGKLLGGGKEEEIIKAQNLIKEILDKKIQNLSEHSIIVIGSTGSGKGTLINYLIGTELACLQNQDTGEFIIDKQNKDINKEFSISHKSISDTAFPHNKLVGTTQFFDLPGFGDTRGAGQDIANSFSLQEVINVSKQKKIVFVVNDSAITQNRGERFRDMVNNIANAFSTSIKDNLCLVVSHSQVSRNVNHIKNYITQILNDQSLHLNDSTKNIMQHLADSQKTNVSVFNKPSQEGVVGSQNREAIKQSIESIQYSNAINIDHVKVLSPESRELINDIVVKELTNLLKNNHSLKEVEDRIDVKIREIANSQYNQDNTALKNDIVNLQSLSLESRLNYARFLDDINPNHGAQKLSAEIEPFNQRVIDVQNKLLIGLEKAEKEVARRQEEARIRAAEQEARRVQEAARRAEEQAELNALKSLWKDVDLDEYNRERLGFGYSGPINRLGYTRQQRENPGYRIEEYINDNYRKNNYGKYELKVPNQVVGVPTGTPGRHRDVYIHQPELDANIIDPIINQEKNYYGNSLRGEDRLKDFLNRTKQSARDIESWIYLTKPEELSKFVKSNQLPLGISRLSENEKRNILSNQILNAETSNNVGYQYPIRYIPKSTIEPMDRSESTSNNTADWFNKVKNLIKENPNHQGGKLPIFDFIHGGDRGDAVPIHWMEDRNPYINQILGMHLLHDRGAPEIYTSKPPEIDTKKHNTLHGYYGGMHGGNYPNPEIFTQQWRDQPNNRLKHKLIHYLDNLNQGHPAVVNQRLLPHNTMRDLIFPNVVTTTGRSPINAWERSLMMAEYHPERITKEATASNRIGVGWAPMGTTPTFKNVKENIDDYLALLRTKGLKL
jgi:energy-coupling factor transporter ATP-binding protein EcfA2